MSNVVLPPTLGVGVSAHGHGPCRARCVIVSSALNHRSWPMLRRKVLSLVTVLTSVLASGLAFAQDATTPPPAAPPAAEPAPAAPPPPAAQPAPDVVVGEQAAPAAKTSDQ